MKYIHVVSKKMTRNGPKRVILKSTTIFYGTDVNTIPWVLMSIHNTALTN